MSAETHTRFFETGSPENPVRLRDGGVLPGVRIAYETWGKLNEEKSNAVFLFHALSGSHHAAGYNPGIEGVGALWQEELHAGWWEDMIGSGKPLDTDKYFIICANYLGGCYGSTGPVSVNPATGKPWGSTFPAVTAADQVEMFKCLIDDFGIDALHAVVGPSVGGLIALTFATRFPERVRNVISIGSGYKTTVLNRLILFEQILAIENDPYFNGGDYYDAEAPLYGLALARMISHKTFVHLDAIEHGDKIIFLHTVKDGPASQSYGLQVAALAGVPRSVIDKAKTKLRHLEDHAYTEQQTATGVNQLDLFSAKECHPVVTFLEDVKPDDLSPRQALELVYKLKGLV